MYWVWVKAMFGTKKQKIKGISYREARITEERGN